MTGPPERFPQLRALQRAACVAAMIGGLLLAGAGLSGFASSGRVWMVAAGGIVIFVAILALTLTPLLLKIEASLARQLTVARDLNEALAKQATALQAISDNTRISDAAKSLAHRGEELGALRSAIREEVRCERWEAALTLINEMEQRFGYNDEAESCREELDDARNERIQAKLAEAIEMIESHFASYEWDRAQSEIDRLMHALPEDARVLSLQDRMGTLKEQHKQELQAAWDLAVRRNDTDHAIEVLKELDQYLSPAEAKAIQNSARDVFKEKLLRVGVQFRFAVKEKRWQDALDTGLELIRDFPNARMANEVREALDTLRERSRQMTQSNTTAQADAS